MKNIILSLNLDEIASITLLDKVASMLSTEYDVNYINASILQVAPKAESVSEPAPEETIPQNIEDTAVEPEVVACVADIPPIEGPPELIDLSSDAANSTASNTAEIDVYINSLGVSTLATITQDASADYDATMLCDMEDPHSANNQFITFQTCSIAPTRNESGICQMYMTVNNECCSLRVNLIQRDKTADFKLLINNSYLSNNMQHDQISTQ